MCRLHMQYLGSRVDVNTISPVGQVHRVDVRHPGAEGELLQSRAVGADLVEVVVVVSIAAHREEDASCRRSATSMSRTMPSGTPAAPSPRRRGGDPAILMAPPPSKLSVLISPVWNMVSVLWWSLRYCRRTTKTIGCSLTSGFAMRASRRSRGRPRRFASPLGPRQSPWLAAAHRPGRAARGFSGSGWLARRPSLPAPPEVDRKRPGTCARSGAAESCGGAAAAGAVTIAGDAKIRSSKCFMFRPDSPSSGLKRGPALSSFQAYPKTVEKAYRR